MKVQTYGLNVEKSLINQDLKFLITDEGIPIQDVCLWLDIKSINSYLTGERYAYALVRYLRFLKRHNIHYSQVNNANTIEEYLKDLLGLGQKVVNQEAPLTYQAIKTHITVLKSFYSWLENEKKVIKNPVFTGKSTHSHSLMKAKLLYGQIWEFDIEQSIISRTLYKEKRNHLKWYSDKEIEGIKSELKSLRDKVVFSISISTGMRIGEILGLKVDDFQYFERTLLVKRQKNTENKALAKTTERTVHIYQDLAEMIQTYMVTDRSIADPFHSNYLFLNGHGTYKGLPLRSRNFLRILKDAASRAGLDRTTVRTHSGRSTRAQQLIQLMREHPELGITKAFIDEELGWKSERSIKAYERGYSNKEKRNILERIKPIILNETGERE